MPNNELLARRAAELGTNGVTYLPDGTVNIAEEAAGRLRSMLRPFGIDVGRIKTRDELFEALGVFATARQNKSASMALMASIFAEDPAEEQRLMKLSEALWEREMEGRRRAEARKKLQLLPGGKA